MAMENKRIIQLSTERLNLSGDDYVMVDSATDGSAKYRLDRLKETDSTLSVSGMAADAAATGQAISDEATARGNAVSAEAEARAAAVTAEAQTRSAADTALGNDVDDLKSAFNYIVNYTKELIGYHVDSSGFISENANYKLFCVDLMGHTKIKHFEFSGTYYNVIYAFFESEPVAGARSYNNSRTVVVETTSVDDIVIPDGCKWVTFTVNVADVAKVSFLKADAVINQMYPVFTNISNAFANDGEEWR